MTVSEIIQQRKQEILDKWKDTLYKEMPVVSNYEESAIENSVPDLLDAMADALSAGEHDEVVFHSQEHGIERARFSNYNLGHVIKEYNLLRRIIFDIIDKQEDVTEDDRNTIIYVIDQAIEQASDTYHRRTQQVIIDARDLAEQKADRLNLRDQNREEFIQSITHDLNNPLNNIKAGIELLEGDIEINELSTVLQIIRSSLTRAELLVEDFLDVGRVEGTEKLPITREIANVTQELHDEIAVFQLVHKREISFEPEKEDIQVSVDIRLVKRAFDNLMNNAIKHSKNGTKIQVQCGIKDDHLQISIKNTGEISETILNKIFDRYYQPFANTKGWGIGLAFVKAVAEAHEGSIEVTSDEGEVIFTMILGVG